MSCVDDLVILCVCHLVYMSCVYDIVMLCVRHLVLHMSMHTIFRCILYLSSFYTPHTHHASYVHVIVLYTSCTTPLSLFPSTSTSPLAYPLYHTMFHYPSLSLFFCAHSYSTSVSLINLLSLLSPPSILYFMSFIYYTRFSMALTY